MKLLPLLGSAYSGSMAGVTASHNAGGAYFRSRTMPTNPSSPAQNALRAATASATQEWSSELTDQQRDGWDLYAQNTTWTDSLGQTIRLSGVNHFVRSNSIRIYAREWLGQSALTTVYDPPTTFALGITPQLTVTGTEQVTGTELEGDLTNHASYPGSSALLTFVSGAVNPALRFFAGPYILAGELDISGPLTTPIALLGSAPYTDRYPAVTAGQAVWGYSRVTMADGRLSSKARWGPVVIAEAE